MKNTLRKIAVLITIPILCALIVWNTYHTWRNLKLIQENTAQRLEASEMQSDISRLLFDLQEMETGQRGYLVTSDTSYLQPYNEASARLPNDFAALRSRLSSTRDRALLTEIETNTEAKIEEIKETIRFRERGYRRRAFLIVDTNRGKELMDDARAKLESLAAAQTANILRYDNEMRQSVSRAIREAALGSCSLLLVALISFAAFNTYRKRLETASARQQEELQATSLKLEQLTSTVFTDLRGIVDHVRGYTATLLDVYGGFLPRQGQEKVERIDDGARYMIHMLDGLSAGGSSAARADMAADVGDAALSALPETKVEPISA